MNRETELPSGDWWPEPDQSKVLECGQFAQVGSNQVLHQQPSERKHSNETKKSINSYLEKSNLDFYETTCQKNG
jgi:hypothetical protein